MKKVFFFISGIFTLYGGSYIVQEIGKLYPWTTFPTIFSTGLLLIIFFSLFNDEV